jgi:hypothetical protein
MRADRSVGLQQDEAACERGLFVRRKQSLTR